MDIKNTTQTGGSKMASKTKVEFVKVFKSGLLKGLAVKGELPFPSFGGAENWINSVRWKVDHGQTDYALDSARILEGRKVVHQWFNN